jgi:hypothetical protein
MDAQINIKMEECARSMGSRSNDAAANDVQIKPSSKEECVIGVTQSTNFAAKVDAQM